MPNYRTSLAFAQLPDGDLPIFAQNTVTQMTENEGFPTPRVTLGNITVAVSSFQAALQAAEDGGTQATAEKNVARAALIVLLRQQAAYVQSIAGSNLPLLLSSGFQAASTNRTRIVLPKTVVKTVSNLQTGTLKITVDPVPTARGYELRYKNGTGDYAPGGVFTSSRGIMLESLSPGATYTVQLRGIGGLTGYGDWSDPVSHMAM